jgi:hypothetical protein
MRDPVYNGTPPARGRRIQRHRRSNHDPPATTTAKPHSGTRKRSQRERGTKADETERQEKKETAPARRHQCPPPLPTTTSHRHKHNPPASTTAKSHAGTRKCSQRERGTKANETGRQKIKTRNMSTGTSFQPRTCDCSFAPYRHVVKTRAEWNRHLAKQHQDAAENITATATLLSEIYARGVACSDCL